MQLSKVLSVASLLFGLVFYVAAVAGVLWPATSPGDVGIVASAGVFVLLGLVGLLLKPQGAHE